MVTKKDNTNPFSIKKIYRSIFSPSSSGEEAAKEYIKNSAKKLNNISTDIIIENIKNRLARGETVRVASFGTRKRATHRMARNPRTGEIFQIKTMNVPFFKAGKKLKEKVK